MYVRAGGDRLGHLPRALDEVHDHRDVADPPVRRGAGRPRTGRSPGTAAMGECGEESLARLWVCPAPVADRRRRPDRHAAAGDPLPAAMFRTATLWPSATASPTTTVEPVDARCVPGSRSRTAIARLPSASRSRSCGAAFTRRPLADVDDGLDDPVAALREARQLVDDSRERRRCSASRWRRSSRLDGGDDLHPVGAGGVARRARSSSRAWKPGLSKRSAALVCPTRTSVPPNPTRPNAASIESGLPLASKTTVGRSPRPRSRRTCGKCSSTTSASRPDAAAKATVGRDVGHQQPFDTGLRRQRHGQADRAGAEHQHAVAGFRPAPRHGVPADAEGLDEHELVDESAAAPGTAGRRAAPCVPQPARGRHTQYLSCGTCPACRRGRGNCCERIEVLGVTTAGGLRERMVLPAAQLFPGRRLTVDQLVLVETLGIGWHAVARGRPESSDSVLVLGAGPVGLAVALAAQPRVERLLVADIAAERVAFAAASGLDALVVDEHFPQVLRDRGRGDLPTVVFDASGSPDSMEAAFGLVGVGGTLVLVGHTKAALRFDNPGFHARELDVRASRNATRADWVQVIAAVEDGSIDATGWLNHRTTLPAVVDELPRLAERRTGSSRRSSTSARGAPGERCAARPAPAGRGGRRAHRRARPRTGRAPGVHRLDRRGRRGRRAGPQGRRPDIAAGSGSCAAGMPIGSATARSGRRWVHTHNLASDYLATFAHRRRSPGDRTGPAAMPRRDGRVGIRNVVVVVYLVECAQQVAEAIAAGRGRARHRLRRLLPERLRPGDAGAAVHPSERRRGGCSVSLGCEGFDRERLADVVAASGRPVTTLVIQRRAAPARRWPRAGRGSRRCATAVPPHGPDGAVRAGGRHHLRRLRRHQRHHRQPRRRAGSSTCWSPQAGRPSSRRRASSSAASTSWRRARSPPSSGPRSRPASPRRRDYYATMGYGSFAPGNAEGGLTTLEEKSLGAYPSRAAAPIHGS